MDNRAAFYQFLFFCALSRREYDSVMQKAFRAIVRGRVQMVMYRDFAARAALEFSIVGSVRNCDDGAVEVIAEGEEVALHSFIVELKKGPMLARVDTIVVNWQEPSSSYSDFEIK